MALNLSSYEHYIINLVHNSDLYRDNKVDGYGEPLPPKGWASYSVNSYSLCYMAYGVDGEEIDVWNGPTRRKIFAGKLAQRLEEHAKTHGARKKAYELLQTVFDKPIEGHGMLIIDPLSIEIEGGYDHTIRFTYQFSDARNQPYPGKILKPFPEDPDEIAYNSIDDDLRDVLDI